MKCDKSGADLTPICPPLPDVLAGEMDGINNKEIMELLLVTQYFDMVKDVGMQSKNSTLFMSHSPAAISQVSAQLRQALTKDNEPSEQKMQR